MEPKEKTHPASLEEELERLRQENLALKRRLEKLEGPEHPSPEEPSSGDKLQEALLESQKDFWEVLTTSRNILYRYNVPKERYDYVSSYAVELLGFSMEEIMERGLDIALETVHPEDRPRFQEVLEQAHLHPGKENRPHLLEYRRLDRHGRWVWMRDWLTAVFSEVGDLKALVGVAYNISESRETEERLRYTETRFREALKNARQVLYNYDIAEERFVYLTPSFEEVTGHRVEDWLSMSLEETDAHIHPEDLAVIVEMRKEVSSLPSKAAVPGTHEFRIRARDGSWIWLLDNHTLHADDKGAPSAVIGSFLDITQRREMEEHLRESERRFQEALDNSTQVLYRLNFRKNRYDYLSPSNDELTGVPLEEWMSQGPEGVLSHLHPDDAKALKEKSLALASRNPGGKFSLQAEYRFRRPDGVWLDLRDTFTMFVDDRGLPEASVGAVTDITESKRLEAHLLESEKRFTEALANTSQILYRFNIRKGRYDYMSPSTRDILGFTAEEWSAFGLDEVMERFHPDDHDGFLAQMEALGQKHKGGKFSLEAEYRIRHKDGAWRHLHDSMTMFTDEDGGMLFSVGAATDITERKKAETRLRESEEMYRLLTENMHDVVWTLDQDYNFTYISPSIKRLRGFTPEEAMSQTVFRTMTPASVDTVRRAMADRERARARGEEITSRVEIEQYRKDGFTVWVEAVVQPILDPRGKTIGYAGVSRDITERRLAEEALRKSEARYRRLFDDAVLGIFRSSLDGASFEVNPAFASIFGYDSPGHMARVLKDAAQDLYADPARRREIVDKVVGSMQPMRTENRYRRRDGSTFEAVLHVWPVREENDIFLEGFVEDVTDLKRAEDELRRAKEELEVRVQERTAELRKSETWLRTLIDSLPFDFWAKDETTRYTMLNSVCRARFGDITGKKTEELDILPEIKERWMNEDKMALAGRTMASGYRAREGGRDNYYESVITPVLEEGRLTGILGVTMDVTERKMAEAALRQSEARFRNLVQLSLQGFIMATGHPPVIQFANQAMADILGRPLTETISLGDGAAASLIHPDDLGWWLEEYRRCLNGEPHQQRYEVRVLRPSGEVRWLEAFQTGVDCEGRPGVQLACVDITQRKAAEARLRALNQETLRAQEAERERIARDLHDNVAQDLSTLKIDIRNLGTGDSSERIRDLGRAIERAVDTVRGMAYELRPPVLDILGVDKTISQLCEEFSMSMKIEVDFTSSGMEYMNIDTETGINIYRIAQEALNNIRKHAFASCAKVRLVASHPHLLLRVEDNGRGFDVDSRSAEAAREKRMGLWSMRERATLLGGTLDVRSRLDKGTRIVLEIPLVKP